MTRTITPSVWGEPMWRTMHVVALGLPRGASEGQRDAYVAFYESLRTVIPCSTCASEYSAIMDSSSPSLREAVSRGADDLFLWTVDVHNRVAERLGKPVMTPEFVREEYLFQGGPETARQATGGAPHAGETRGHAGDGGGRATDAPWSDATFARHAVNPAIVCAAAVAAIGLVVLVLRHAAAAGTGAGARR